MIFGMCALEDIPIGELLPQQPPFRFVDRLVYYNDQEARVSFTPGGGNLLMEDGCLCAAGVLEHMAQASAARTGYYNKYILHLPVRIGFIGQVKKFELFRQPKAGEKLETSVFVRQEVFQITLADVVVKTASGELLATAVLKSALKDE